MTKYISRVNMVEAMQFDGKNFEECAVFAGLGPKGWDRVSGNLILLTDDGDMYANPGCWILKDTEGKGELLDVVKEDAFIANYEQWPRPLVQKIGEPEPNEGHCDIAIHKYGYPLCLRYYLLVERLRAIDRCLIVERYGEPVCFADHEGQRVRLKMASRFGDVGISADLTTPHGYDKRVAVKDLSNFSDVE